MLKYGSNLGTYSNIGTAILGVYNMYSGYNKDGGFGYNFQLAGVQTVGGFGGALAFGKIGAITGAYFGPWGSLILGAGGAIYGGIQGTNSSTNLFNYFNNK